MKSILQAPRGLGRWNSLMGVAVLAAQTATFLALSPLVLKGLGPEAFGIWSLGSTILAFATLLDLGIGEAAAQRVGELGGAKARLQDVAQIASEATRHYRRVALVGFAGAPIVSIALVAAVQFKVLSPAVVFVYFLCASTAFFLGLPSYARAAILVGRGETWAQRVPLLVESFVTLAVSLVALGFGLGLVALGVATLVSRAAGALARAWVFHHIVGSPADLRRPVRDRGSEALINLRGAALPFLLIAVAARFEVSAGPLVLATRVGADEVGPYLFAFRCFFTLLQVTWQLTDYLFPAYRRLVVDRGWSSACRLTEDSLAVTLPIVAVCGCIGSLAYDNVAGAVAHGLVVGPAVTSLLALFAVVYHIVHVLAMGANGSGLQQRVMPFIMADAAVGFALGVVLVGPLGSAGVIAGLVCANSGIALPGLVRIWSVASSEATWQWLAPAVAPAMAAVATLVAIQVALVRAEPALALLAIAAGSGAIVWNLMVIVRRWSSFTSAVREALAAVRLPSSPPGAEVFT